MKLYQGGQYFLCKYIQYSDLRLVFAPEADRELRGRFIQFGKINVGNERGRAVAYGRATRGTGSLGRDCCNKDRLREFTDSALPWLLLGPDHPVVRRLMNNESPVGLATIREALDKVYGAHLLLAELEAK